MPISFGLNKKSGLSKPAVKPQPKPSIGGFGGDDEPQKEASAAIDQALEIHTFDADAAITDDVSETPSKAETSKSMPERPSKAPQARDSSQHGPSLAASFVQQKQAAADEVDPSIYDYDSHYDAIHKAQNDRKVKQAEESASGKPKYMDNLIAASEQRKRDQTRARDKLLQRERELEGDEFADKEKFVTEAYKKQQEEARKLEEEEKKKEEAEEEKKRKQGMTGFYRDVMREREKEHQAALEAAKNYKPGEESAAEEEAPDVGSIAAKRAAELNAKGADIMITDDGEVADKRQLLKGGLNITAKPKPKVASQTRARDADGASQQAGSRIDFESQRAQRERQSRMIEEQLAASQKRAAEEEAEALQKREQSLKSSKTSGDISDAKARFLARKRAQAEAAAAAKK